ncbi:MAG: hypothetical protein GWN00_23760 [Aliifodinibius sp.]|nr:hypothetical protein [Fodinibius sp.]NIY27710.1 hypothetical protein [Fodinibius sp.]
MNIFDSKNSFDWRDYLKILRRRIWYFLVPFVLVVSVGAHKITSNQPIYQSSCYIYTQPSSMHLLPSSIKESLPRVSRFSLNKHVLSKEYFTQLIDHLELDQDQALRNRAKLMKATFPDKSVDEIVEILLLRRLKSSIKAGNIGPNILAIKAKASTPDLAYSLVKALTEIYISDSMERAMKGVQDALSFNDKQTSIYKEKLEEAEKNLERFKRELISSKVGNESLTVESLNRIQNALIAIEIITKEKKDYLEYLSRRLDSLDLTKEFTSNDPTIRRLRQTIDEKVQEMAGMMQRFSWKSPEVINVNRKINDSREEIRDEIGEFLKEKYAYLEAKTRNLHLEKAITDIDLEIQNKKAMALQELIASFREEKSQNPSNEMTLSKLEADVAVNRRLYNMFLRQNQGVKIEERIAQADASDRFKMLEPPNKPTQPINAGMRMILMVTLFTAFGCGLGAVIMREYLDQSVRTVNEAVEAFQLPVIGVLPGLGGAHTAMQRKRRVVWIGFGVSLVVVSLIMWYLNVNPLRFIRF